MKKKSKPKKENGERWLLTYSDMITLLLALFILLYGMSNTDAQKMEQLAAGLNQSLGDGNGISIFDGTEGIMDGAGNSISNPNETGGQTSTGTTLTPGPTGTLNNTPATIETEQDMKTLAKGIDEILNEMGMGETAGTTIEERGLIITFADDVFFDSGKAELKSDMKKGLSQIATLLNRVDNPLVIEGYTDNNPISFSSTFSSNLQLSLVRAGVVAEYLIDIQEVDGARISAVGYGEYRPIASNDTQEGRNKNRRVTITVLYNEITGMEFK